MQYRPRNRRRSRRRVRWGRLIAVLAGLAVAGFGLVKLIGYGVDWMASRQTAQELRAVYYAEITPAPIPAETEQMLAASALTVFRALGLRAYSRADFILDENGDLWFLEINTLPGMTPTSLVPQEAEVVGISYGELCERIIEIALRKD